MADNRTFERDARVEVFADGQWLPALIKNVVPVSGSANNSGAFTYTVAVDLAGQPQFTGRPVRDYPLMKGVSADSLRESGSKTDGDNVVDAYDTNPATDSVWAQNMKFMGVKTADEYYKENDLDDLGVKNDPEAEAATVGTAFQQVVRSDDNGNVTHGANASVQFVGDVTGTNGTGSVNANGEVPAALPNVPVNQTPYTVEASNDPHLGLHLTNIPNTGVQPQVNAVDGAADEVLTKTGNEGPVNPTRTNGKDGKVIASDKFDGALASATPVGSKDDHQVAEAKVEDGEKGGEADQKYPAIDNKPLNEGDADPASEADGTHGTSATLADVDAKDVTGNVPGKGGTERKSDAKSAKEASSKSADSDSNAKTEDDAEKMTDENNKDMKPTQAQADSVVKVHSAPAEKTQLPASDMKVTDGAVPSSDGKKK